MLGVPGRTSATDLRSVQEAVSHSHPMSDKFQYRAVQHNGSKRFEDQPRVLTYRGATYQTRVFEVRYEALKAS